jgi:hypothetical protein
MLAGHPPLVTVAAVVAPGHPEAEDAGWLQ